MSSYPTLHLNWGVFNKYYLLECIYWGVFNKYYLLATIVYTPGGRSAGLRHLQHGELQAHPSLADGGASAH